jgi:1,2-diacylglycerol 3-alpha-glucosyltransferase
MAACCCGSAGGQSRPEGADRAGGAAVGKPSPRRLGALRIAVFTNTYLPSINGVVNSIEAFRKGLQEAGHDVFVFAPQAPEPAGDEDFVFRFRAVSLRRYPEYPVALPLSRSVGDAFRALKPHLVHTQHPWLIGRWGLRLARRAETPVVTTIHTQYEQYAHYAWPIPPGLLNRVLRRTVRNYCEHCDVVATPGTAMKDYLVDLGVTRPIQVVPNATDLSRLDTADGSEVREALGIAGTDCLFAFIGRTAREKNLEGLVRAFSIVAAELPGARLMVVGGGPALDGLQRMAAEQPCHDRVVFTGFVPYERIREYHAAADVFVTASMSEVQPLALTEAMAAGAPIAGVDAHGINDMVEHGQTGLLAPAEEGIEGLARVMLELGRDADERRRMGAAARQASRRYHIPEATERLLQVYAMARQAKARNS